MDIQQISDSAKAIASDAQAIDLRFQASRDLKRRIAPIMASEAPFIFLKTLLMIVIRHSQTRMRLPGMWILERLLALTSWSGF